MDSLSRKPKNMHEENNKWTLTRTLKGEKTPIERLEGFWSGEDPEPDLESPNGMYENEIDFDDEWYNNPRRKNPSTSVLGALILGGIIGHSMKKK